MTRIPMISLVLLLGCAKTSTPTSAPEAAQTAPEPTVLPTLVDHLDGWAADGRPDTVDDERQADLAFLADWIREQAAEGAPAHLLFVCTHNSRRSHMAQLWAQAAATHAGLDHVVTWSGGTEATAFNPRSVRALRTHGFAIEETGEVLGEANVVYATRVATDGAPIRSFSKRYADPFNPASGFAAVMVCSSADRSCPTVEGAEVRVAVPYLDPKASDGSPEEEATYLAKSEEIGREMAWLMALATR